MDKDKSEINVNQRYQVLSELVSRAVTMSRLGQSYDGERDMYEVLGYKLEPDYKDFATQYSRQDIAGAVVDKPIEATWKNGFRLFESDEDDTTLELAWIRLEEDFNITAVFERLDKVSSLGRYGIMLMGFDDVRTQLDFQRPVIGKRKLIYIKPLSEGSAEIHSYEKRSNNPRYGLPVFYSVAITNPGDDTTSELLVHHSRVIHVARNLTESEVEGRSQLKRVFNRLKDLEKLVGGSAEMFWRGARPGYQGKVDSDYMITPERRQDLQDEISEYEHNLRRILINEGIQLDAMAPQISSPKDHVDIQIQMISAETGIPKRILTGSERGELSSSQDQDSWFQLIERNQLKHAGPNIIRPFVDRCIKYGVLPESLPEGYKIVWEDLYTFSDKEKAEVGKIRADSLAAYEKSLTAKSTIPTEVFIEYFLGLSKDDADYIINLMKENLDGMIESEQELEEIVPEEEVITEGVE